MSWAFEIVGHPDAVTTEVNRQKPLGSDQSQLDMVKAFIQHELSFHTASRGDGVRVIASGHHGPDGRSLSIVISPVQLALDT